MVCELLPSYIFLPVQEINTSPWVLNDRQVQNIGFKKIEISLQHEVVKNLLNLFDENGVKAYGMSSFGPSVVGITESNQDAAELFEAVHRHLRNTGGHIYICKPNNTGAKIEYLEWL